MFFRIARNTVMEGLSHVVHGRSIVEKSLVEAVHLVLKFRSMAMASRGGTVERVLFCLVATQEQEVVDAENLHVDKLVFRILARESGAQKMGHKGYGILTLEHSGNGNAAGTTAHALTHHKFAHALGLWEGGGTIDVFATMVGDIDVFWGEFAQTFDGTPQAVNAVSFERRQHLEGESRRRFFKEVQYVHVFAGGMFPPKF